MEMTQKERIRHEFLLLQSKLGEDAVMFMHLDECPEILDDAFNVQYACNTFRGVTAEELAKNYEAGTMEAFVCECILHTLITGRDVIDELILKVEKERRDAEKTENIKDTTTG
jgi:hypothetical protein